MEFSQPGELQCGIMSWLLFTQEGDRQARSQGSSREEVGLETLPSLPWLPLPGPEIVLSTNSHLLLLQTQGPSESRLERDLLP